ncbi:MAG: MerR family transcriptional regulator [Rhodobacteraceae bacterium]|nr:MerR family transcriptional regulator [Paracoccaceae bacterium]
MALAKQKSAQAFRTISEVADLLDVPAHVLRFWETRFSQIQPVKRGGGRRYYRPEDIALLRGIQDLLHVQGMTIKGVQKVLKDRGLKHVMGIGQEVELTVVSHKPDLKEIVKGLENLRSSIASSL